MRRIRKKEHEKLHPIMTYVILIVVVMLVSSFLNILDVQSTYYTVNSSNMSLVPETETVTSLFSLKGLKYIFTNTVSNFANFTVLSNLLIVLMGISIMDKSGFLQTAITLATKRLKKKTVTFIFTFICVLSSIIGDLSYLILIPLGALLFYYGKRNPAIGIISSFAALSCGSGLNILFTSIDSAILQSTQLITNVVQPNYDILNLSFILIMGVASVIVSFIITLVTENYLVTKVDKYEFTETELEEDIVTKNEEKGIIYAIFAGLVYLAIFAYNIIPNLPFSGALLDNTQINYIDKLFGVNSYFSNGFVFIVTMLFIILGLFYGIGSKSIKNHKDFCNSLGHSLDGMGNVLVMIFFASTFISVFKESNIGNTFVSTIGNLIANSNISGIALIIVVFLVVAVSSILVPSSTIKWSILSTSLVPTMMTSGLTPEFIQIIYKFAETSTMNITPLLAYFIVYLGFLEKYNQSDKKIRLIDALKFQLPYTICVVLVLLTIIVVWYIIGMPLGVNAFPTI